MCNPRPNGGLGEVRRKMGGSKVVACAVRFGGDGVENTNGVLIVSGVQPDQSMRALRMTQVLGDISVAGVAESQTWAANTRMGVTSRETTF